MPKFLAAFPPIQSAIKVGQDGMRIQLDIPESEMGNAVELLGMRDCVLVVTIERERLISKQNGTQKRTDKQSTWQTTEGASDCRAPVGGSA